MDRAPLTPADNAAHRQRIATTPRGMAPKQPGTVVRSFTTPMAATAAPLLSADDMIKAAAEAAQPEVAKLVRVSTPAAPTNYAVHEEASAIDPPPARVSFLVRGLDASNITGAWLAASDGRSVADLTVRQLDGAARLDGVADPGVDVHVELELNSVPDGTRVEVLLLGGGRIVP